MRKKTYIMPGAIICLSALAAGALHSDIAQASYHWTSDAGIGKLDYVEERHRREREDALSDEQKQLAAAAEEMKMQLRRPINPAGPAPTTFEGDELTYDQNTGDFIIEGNVHILQSDGHQFDTDEIVTGNTEAREVEIPGLGKIIQITPGTSRVQLDGWRIFYNYGDGIGTIDEAAGKIDHNYLSGKRFEIYPDHMVIYEGETTRCGAEKPDYYYSADKITVYPNDQMILENAAFYIKGTKIYSKARIVEDISPSADEGNLPRFGYDSSDGVWMSYDLPYKIAPRVGGNFHFYANTKDGVKSNTNVNWTTKSAGYFELQYGNYEDSNSYWIFKEPSLRYYYANHLKGSPWGYNFQAEYGRWHSRQSDITSNHSYGRIGIGRDPIILGDKWVLLLSGGYSVTNESYNGKTNKGFDWDITTIKEFDDRTSAYFSYVFNTNNTSNSLFNYGVDDYSRKFQAGLSYYLTDRDRLAVALEYNLDNNNLSTVDYYWFRDLHCAEAVIRYRAKQKTWHFLLEFTPW